ncbi:nitroreductase family protein [Miltoncostaea marina]|uniref:nitroreductase family protein n=1 Tax=Miltoncostaea marina TaxID=2843215 RepID=UPI001C3CBB14|nr:nitroreductase family protein [Miltoncostaea marina]
MEPPSADELLSTTRSVRRRLDLTRPVERRLIEECLALAQQAPSGGNRQGAVFVVVTDPGSRRALGELYRSAWDRYLAEGVGAGRPGAAATPSTPAQQRRIGRSAAHLAEHLGEVPVHVIPCHRGRTEGAPQVVQASAWGSVLPAAWSFMLAARARGLGSAWTTLHLFHEREAAELLGIPYEEYSQAALIPVAHVVGSGFRPAPRAPLGEFARWEAW